MAGFSTARGTLSGASSGIAQALGALMGGDRAQQAGYDAEQTTQTKMAQVLAQVQQAQAAARLHDAQTAEAVAKTGQTTAETAVLNRRPGIADLAMAAQAGTDVPTLNGYRQRLQTGQAPDVSMGPPAEDGSMGKAQMQFDPETASRLGQALVRLGPVLNSAKDINPEQYAKGASVYRGMDLGDQVLGGQRTAGQVGAAQAAVEGKPLYHAGENGAVLDLFGGGLNEAGGLAQGGIALRREQAGAQRANAAQSYAAADNSRASAGLHRAQTGEVNSGMGAGGKAPAGYRWGPDRATLEVIPGGPADPNTKEAKLAKPPTEGQAKALLFGSRMAAANEVLAEMAKDGVNRPGMVKQITEGTLGALPLVGGALATAGGALTNGTQSPAQQQVEQAQRDFVNAVLRRESGAVISPVEFTNARLQYFPQPGDSPAVLRQKAANRQTAISGFKAEFGDAMAPEFDRIVSESRAARQKPAKAQPKPAPNTGGASGDWGDGGWKMERVN